MQTQHSETTFKHILLPLWSAAFQFRDKTYRFVVNGRSGKIRGERPYSVIKIAAAVLAGALVVAAGVWYAQQSGAFEEFGAEAFDFGINDPFRQDRRYQFPERPDYRF